MGTFGSLRTLGTGYCTLIAPTSSAHQTFIQTSALRTKVAGSITLTTVKELANQMNSARAATVYAN